MRLLSYFILASIFIQNSFAQIQFTPKLNLTEHQRITAFSQGKQIPIFADVDNDNDMDLLLIGRENSLKAELHLNDGNGNFTKTTQTFIEVANASAAFADVDNDNDLDLLISGEDTVGHQSIVLYINDGNGIYSRFAFTPFQALPDTIVNFADIDGDNDQDAIISANNETKIYLNDGNGNFTLSNITININVKDLTLNDFDNDNDIDIIIIGTNGIYIYKNDGSGIFTQSTINGSNYSTIAISDIDGDNDLDLIVSGINTKIFTNDGNGDFIYQNGFIDVSSRGTSVTFFDFDNDNDTDIIISGYDYSKVFINDGNGIFIQNENIFLPKGNAAVADIDNDNDNDIIIDALYLNDGNAHLIKNSIKNLEKGKVIHADIDGDNDLDLLILDKEIFLYKNDGHGNFSIFPNSFLPAGYSAAFADVDGDGDEDVMISGEQSYQSYVTKLYINDGFGNFTMSNASFVNVSYSSIAFADVDGDGDKDVMISGAQSHYSYVSKLYINDSSGNFTESTNNFTGIVGVVVFEDIDGDNDQDLLISGNNGNSSVFTGLYTNDGNGNFSLDTNSSLIQVGYSDAAFADFNGDNSPDLIISGKIGYNYTYYTNIYTNDGNGNFSIHNTPYEMNLSNASISIGDIDGDNDMDIMLTGRARNARHSSLMIFKNDGNCDFIAYKPQNVPVRDISSATLVNVNQDNNLDIITSNPHENIIFLNENNSFRHVTNSQIFGIKDADFAFCDIDGDNDQDLLIVGDYLSLLYKNDGNGNFTQVLNTPFESVKNGKVAFADIDGDNDQDVLIAGEMSTGNSSTPFTSIYINDGSGNFSPYPTSIRNIFPKQVVFVDIDGDNDMDLYISGKRPNDSQTKSYFYFNNGNGVFSSPNQYYLRSKVAYFYDIDGDNDMDVLYNEQGTDRQAVRISINDGTGTFSSTFLCGANLLDVVFADINLDGNTDILTLQQSYSRNAIKAYYGDNNGGFSEFTQGHLPSYSYYHNIISADVDGDNDPDLLAVSNTNIFSNDHFGNMSLVKNNLFDLVKFATNANFVDIDGDNDLDILFTGQKSIIFENITIPDTTPPIVACQNVSLTLNNNGMVRLTPELVDNGSVDNVDIIQYSLSQSIFDCSNLNDNDVTLTVYDSSGNYDSCNTIVTIVDDRPPIALAQNIQVNMAGNSSVTISANDVDNGSWDNCGIVSRDLSQDTFNSLGTYSIDFTVTDSSGNSNFSTVDVEVVNSANIDDKGDSRANNLLIYPNPIKERLTIKSNDTIQSVTVFDISGKKIIDFFANNTEINLNFESLKNGLYILNIKINNSIVMAKIIKN